MYFKESFNLSDPQMFKSALTLEGSFDISGEKVRIPPRAQIFFASTYEIFSPLR
jgi:hypothetical protein